MRRRAMSTDQVVFTQPDYMKHKNNGATTVSPRTKNQALVYTQRSGRIQRYGLVFIMPINSKVGCKIPATLRDFCRCCTQWLSRICTYLLDTFVYAGTIINNVWEITPVSPRAEWTEAGSRNDVECYPQDQHVARNQEAIIFEEVLTGCRTYTIGRTTRHNPTQHFGSGVR